MMELALLKEVRTLLKDNMKDANIYYSTHEEMTYPCCVVELEEIWTGLDLAKDSIIARIKFSTKYYSKDIGIQTCLTSGSKIASALEGKVLDLDADHRAVIRLVESVVESGRTEEIKRINHTYESIIRR